ncbi:contractile injection system protein, VgrG/Pvc8 family [Paenibacillus tyrfis]|uniref:contractile injection system protein, VgrG/Pvc8 family n=1 Tax=Paenibacillus tyrfis TaxID=1501230 RepID=UPI0020A1D6E7|nr:contractile injection system protein, VgrG/Pvc8 family [Paenibacillus tyrfis]MCP1308089.1 phage late control D family protein [Paenibacillus tyrfis]
MSSNPITYGQLEITPYQFSRLSELRIEQKLNEHARLTLTGIVPEQLQDSYVDTTSLHTPIEVRQRLADDYATLFSGIVTNVRMKKIGEVYSIEIEAASYTYLLDVQPHNQSFQHRSMTYGQLLEQVISSYADADVMDLASGGQTLGQFVLQYQETDWQFLKRMASRFHTYLVPVPYFTAPKFVFGIPEGRWKGDLDVHSFTVNKRIGEYRDITQNHGKEVNEHDFISYEVHTNEMLELGTQVVFRQKELFVCEAVSVMTEGILQHAYVLAPRQGLVVPTAYNTAIIGLSLQGKILQVKRDQVKVHLEIDDEQHAQEASWFPYSTIFASEDNTGWYCMPEVGDSIRIYFPNSREERAIAISSVRREAPDAARQPEDPMCNPDIPYLKTKHGQIIKFLPTGIEIMANAGVYIKLTDDGVITVASPNKIHFSSTEEISFEAPDIKVAAGKSLKMECQGNSIEIKEGEINISGSQVKTN